MYGVSDPSPSKNPASHAASVADMILTVDGANQLLDMRQLLVESRARFELAMSDLGNHIPSAGRDVVASSGVEPLSVRLEGASPCSFGEAEIGAEYGSRTHPDYIGNVVPHLAVPCMIGRHTRNRTQVNR
jgi:hypothetical protein